jgi:hypothetical protein
MQADRAEKQPPGDDPGQNKPADQPSQEDQAGPKKRKYGHSYCS